MYRIISKQRFNFNRLFMSTLSEHYMKSKYYVQHKYKHIPFWFTVTTGFDSLEQAQEYIEAALDIKG